MASTTFLLGRCLLLAGLQLKLLSLLADVLNHCHWLVILLFFRVDLHQFGRDGLECLLDVLAGFRTHLQVGNALLLAEFAHLLLVYFSLLFNIIFVAEDYQLNVRNGVFFDLHRGLSTSLSQ
jgi:hypothetical protein